MIVGQFDCVTLRDGTEGTIADVLEPGSAYEFEPADHHSRGDDEPVTFSVTRDDIVEVSYKARAIAAPGATPTP